MVISHTHPVPFIFVHVYKAAGSSMVKSLKPYGVNDGLPYHLTAKQIRHATQHEFYDWSENYLPEDRVPDVLRQNPNAWDDYFTFAFVRNPYDFCVSLFYWIRNNRSHDMREHLNDITFNHFIEELYDPSLCKLKFQHGSPTIFRRPLKTFIEDESGEIIVDFVGKVENVEEDYQHVCDVLKIENDLGKFNRSARPSDYRDCYNDRTRKLVEEIYAKDFEFFGYEF